MLYYRDFKKKFEEAEEEAQDKAKRDGAWKPNIGISEFALSPGDDLRKQKTSKKSGKNLNLEAIQEGEEGEEDDETSR